MIDVKKAFYDGFEAGVEAEGGGDVEHWSSSMRTFRDQVWMNYERHLAETTPPTFTAPPEPIVEQEPDAPDANRLIDLHMRAADIIRKRYFRYTRNEQLAHETALAVLEEVQRTYEQLAAAAGLTTG